MKAKILTILTIVYFIGTSFAQYTLEPLPYAYDALEPFIDAKTMEVHYSKHHANYLNNLNTALKDTKLEYSTDIYELLNNISKYSSAVKNNAGGVFNHTFFWNVLTPKKDTKPSAKLLADIEKTFVNFSEFKTQFIKSGATLFGSGWVWVIVTKENELKIVTTNNQDNTIMDNSAVKGTPILCVDVWEHAYYLKYQNKRAEYLENIWNVIDWEKVSNLYEKAVVK
jgi:Fe-Mn family superoxide dismutase